MKQWQGNSKGVERKLAAGPGADGGGKGFGAEPNGQAQKAIGPSCSQHHRSEAAVAEDGNVIRIFSVSPTGEFEIVSRLANPSYYHPGVVIPQGKDNPVGTRWIGLNKRGTEFTERIRRGRSGKLRRMGASACATERLSSFVAW